MHFPGKLRLTAGETEHECKTKGLITAELPKERTMDTRENMNSGCANVKRCNKITAMGESLHLELGGAGSQYA